MGGSNTKLENDLWTGSGSMSRYKSDSESPQKSKQSPVEPKKGELRTKEKEIVDDPKASNDPEGDIIDRDLYDPKTAGPIFPNGEINWDCPCLGGAAHGPCGTEFREAFSCFHHSEDEIKGSDCFPHFREMSTCFSKYPDLYGSKGIDDDEDEDVEDDKSEVEFDQEELDLINQEDGSGDRKMEETKEKNKNADQDHGDDVKPNKKSETVPKAEPKKSRKFGDVKENTIPLPGSQAAL